MPSAGMMTCIWRTQHIKEQSGHANRCRVKALILHWQALAPQRHLLPKLLQISLCIRCGECGLQVLIQVCTGVGKENILHKGDRRNSTLNIQNHCLGGMLCVRQLLPL